MPDPEHVTELTGPVAGTPGFLPQYDPPGLSVRATFLATDGTRPQELIVEWKIDPGQAALDFVLNAIAEIAQPSEVRTEVRVDVERDVAKYGHDLPGRITPTEGPFGQVAPDPDAPTETLALQLCNLVGPGHDDTGHFCSLFSGHAPVEPGGRAHRCNCGGIFSTPDEVPDVPGRSEQERRRQR